MGGCEEKAAASTPRDENWSFAEWKEMCSFKRDVAGVVVKNEMSTGAWVGDARLQRWS
jgi:hypothetical protein